MVKLTHHQGTPLIEEAREAQIKQRFFELVCIMKRLRRDCPWDRKQTPQTLKRYVLEETYEVLASIESEDWQGLREELGDFLFQVLFQAEIQGESERFQIEDVLGEVIDKMVRRHPHVFEDQELTAEQVSANWERIKAEEKGAIDPSLFAHMTPGLPALLQSFKIGKKAATVGFDWPDPHQVLDKIEEEIGEIREAVGHPPEKLQEELGDLMFALSNLVRKFGFEPEETLRQANHKFVRRFQTMETLARHEGIDFASLDLDQQESYWARAKQTERDHADP